MATLVLYLAEENPDMISYAKLDKALKQREGDSPLEQYGAKVLQEYQARLRRQLNEPAGAPSGAVADLARWMRERRWTIKDVFGASHAAGGVISASNFIKSLRAKEIGYPQADAEACKRELAKPDTIETLGSSTKEVVDLEALKQALHKLSGQAGGGVGDKDVARGRLGVMSVAQRRIIEQISQELRRLDMSTDDLHR